MLVSTLVIVLVLSLMPVEQIPLSDWNDKLQHWLAFITISGLVDAAWPNSHFNWKKMLFVMVYGGLIEVLQSFTGYREISGADLLADAVGALSYMALIPLWKKIPIINLRWEQPSDSTNHTAEK